MKHLLTFGFLTMGGVAFGQDSTQSGKLTINGSIDFYYRFNLQNAKDSGRTNNLTSYTNSQNSFELGMATIKADYTAGKVDGIIDLGFGRRAEETSYNDGDPEQGKNGFISLANVKQAYLSFAPDSHVKFTAGKWFTHVGYEVVDPYLNRNYSMDYLFSYGPFFHTGIKMDVNASKNFAFMIGVSNPTDHTSASFEKKNALAQLHATTTNAALNVYINYIGGRDVLDEMTNQFDLVATDLISQKFSVGYNGSVKMVRLRNGDQSSWWGSTIYLNYDPVKSFGLTARGEYFNDNKNVAGIGTHVIDFTLSGNIRVGQMTIIPELRVDSGGAPIFFNNEDASIPERKTTATLLLAVTYNF